MRIRYCGYHTADLIICTHYLGLHSVIRLELFWPNALTDNTHNRLKERERERQKQRETERDRERGRERERKRQRQTERERVTETETQRERLGLFSLFTFQPRPMAVDEEDFFWNRSGRQT